MSGADSYINITGVQVASTSPYTSDNNKLYTSGRTQYEIDTAKQELQQQIDDLEQEIVDNTYNYVVDEITIVDSENPLPPASASSADILFVYDKRTEPYYYELLLKEESPTGTYSYIRYDVPISSIVLDKQNEDIYTIYDKTDPTGTETVPGRYQTWVRTDRFNEDIQINLTHQDISLTTAGHIRVDATYPTGTLTSDQLKYAASINYVQNHVSANYVKLASNTEQSITGSGGLKLVDGDLSLVSTSTSSTITDTITDSTITLTDSTTNNDTHSVVISSTNPNASASTPIAGSSVILTGSQSYIETPILRLKVVN